LPGGTGGRRRCACRPHALCVPARNTRALCECPHASRAPSDGVLAHDPRACRFGAQATRAPAVRVASRGGRAHSLLPPTCRPPGPSVTLHYCEVLQQRADSSPQATGLAILIAHPAQGNKVGAATRAAGPGHVASAAQRSGRGGVREPRRPSWVPPSRAHAGRVRPVRPPRADDSDHWPRWNPASSIWLEGGSQGTRTATGHVRVGMSESS
jgi:hypothetical protein